MKTLKTLLGILATILIFTGCQNLNDPTIEEPNRSETIENTNEETAVDNFTPEEIEPNVKIFHFETKANTHIILRKEEKVVEEFNIVAFGTIAIDMSVYSSVSFLVCSLDDDLNVESMINPTFFPTTPFPSLESTGEPGNAFSMNGWRIWGCKYNQSWKGLANGRWFSYNQTF